MKRFAPWILVTGLVLLGCQDPQLPTSPSADLEDPTALTDDADGDWVSLETDVASQISDGAHGDGNPDFFFLPPLVRHPRRHEEFSSGEFNPDLAPVVEVCALNTETGECADPQPDGLPVVLDDTGRRRWERVRVHRRGEYYSVHLRTHRHQLDVGGVYRVRVLVNAQELGHVDVKVVRRLWHRWKRHERRYFLLRHRRTLPIRFRIEGEPPAEEPLPQEPPAEEPPPEEPFGPEIIAFASTRDGYSRIYAMRPDGSGVRALTDDPAGDFQPAVSPDGSKILFRRGESLEAELYVMNADGSGVTNLSNSERYDGDASWSPDGKKIAFRSQRDRNWEIYVMDGDGQNPTRITLHGAHDAEPSWSPDGYLATMADRVDSQYDIYKIWSGGGPDVTQLTSDPGTDGNPSWAPTGTIIAFESDRVTVDPNAPETEVYLIDSANYLAGVTRLTNSPGFDGEPDWSPDGTRIVFTSAREGGLEIWAMNTDGTGLVRLTDSAGDNRTPSWSGASGGAQ